MNASRTTRLAELAAPQRLKPRYAPLTAGLLARKGEAAPATSFFTADAMGAHSGSGPNARIALPSPEPEDEIYAGDWAGDSHAYWRSRRPVEEPREEFAAHKLNGAFVHEPASATHVHVTRPAEVQQEATRAALQVELELEILARLALEARRKAATPAEIIEAALAAHLPSTGHCPLCDLNRGR